MPRTPAALSWSCLLAALLPAQARTVLPAACADLPGNAAVALPLRWSHGSMQVLIDQSLLPASLQGQTLTGLRLRRPAFLGEPAYAALQRTVTVRGGFHSRTARQATQSLAVNRPANAAVLFGPAPLAVAATPATGSATARGAEFVHIAFTTPLPVVAGNLFLEFETSDAPLTVSAEHWVDAVWCRGGSEDGYAVTVGDGSCTTRSAPTELTWSGASGPRRGQSAELQLRGALPGALVCQWIGIEPLQAAVGPSFVGYGNSLGAIDPGLAACHQWAPLDVFWLGTADVGGNRAVSFPLTAAALTAGMRLGVQAGWIDPARPGLPLSVSNGVVLVLDQLGVADRCSTVFFPASNPNTPWAPNLGLMPALVVEH